MKCDKCFKEITTWNFFSSWNFTNQKPRKICEDCAIEWRKHSDKFFPVIDSERKIKLHSPLTSPQDGSVVFFKLKSGNLLQGIFKNGFFEEMTGEFFRGKCYILWWIYHDDLAELEFDNKDEAE